MREYNLGTWSQDVSKHMEIRLTLLYSVSAELYLSIPRILKMDRVISYHSVTVVTQLQGRYIFSFII